MKTIIKYMPTNDYTYVLQAVQQLMQENATGVYISAARPLHDVVEDLQERNVDIDSIFFIDIFPKTPELNVSNTLKVVPFSLQKLSELLHQACAAFVGKKNFVICDNTNAIFGEDVATSTRFMLSLMQNLKKAQIMNIFCIVRAAHTEWSAHLEEEADEVLSGEK